MVTFERIWNLTFKINIFWVRTWSHAERCCKIYFRGIGANINNTSANITSLMRGNYSGTEVFLCFTCHHYDLPQANHWKQDSRTHILFLAYTRVSAQKTLILGGIKTELIWLISCAELQASNICFPVVTWGSCCFRKHNYFHPIIYMRFSWNINHIS